MSPNFLIVFCIKSLMFDLKNYIQIPHKLSCVCVCLSFIHALPTRVERPRSTQTQGPRRSAADCLINIHISSNVALSLGERNFFMHWVVVNAEAGQVKVMKISDC